MEIDTNHLHHAYLLEGDHELGQLYLGNLLERLHIEQAQNPDYFVLENEAFTIGEARTLTEQAIGRAYGSKKIFVIKSPRYTPEAQNALLKTLEEPIPHTHFFLLLSDRNLLLPTLLSRLEVVRMNGSQNKQKDAEEFLTLLPQERMNFSKKFVDKEKPLAPFLDSLLILLKNNGAPLSEIEKVFKQRKFADDPSVMPRLILEHLAVVLK
ncbi:hypothetical protein BH11PAT3_BH11PAT3_2670 [soil metagenome]